MFLPYRSKMPDIHKKSFIAQNAVIIGDVSIEEGSSIWFGCTLRGDVHEIKIGARTNIQDGSVIHVTRGVQGSYIGDNVTVGHMALIHACTIGNNVLVGMQSCIMDGACIKDNAMIAAGSLVTPGKTVPSRQLWAGRPARYMRDLSDKDIEAITHSAQDYATLAAEYIENK